MKRVVIINCNSVLYGLRKIYWCIETNENELKRYVKTVGLSTCSKYPRAVFNPLVISDDEVTTAFDNNHPIVIGKLLGYPSPGEAFDKWWISWQIRDPKNVFEYLTLFNFQMKTLDTKKLIKMKEKWNKTFDNKHYFDFNIRYRKNKKFSD